jgi:hypothetical protein
MLRGQNHLVTRHPSLQQHASPSAAGTDKTGRPNDERHRLLGSPKPWRKQLVVELQKHHRVR